MKRLEVEGPALTARQKWDLLSRSWAVTTPPAAPSDDDAANYLRTLPEDAEVVLLLGCTPKLRSAICRHGLRVVSVDISPAMIQVSRTDTASSPADSFIVGDWANLPISGSVDAIFGDKVFGNITPDLWPAVVRELARVAGPGAPLMTRATPHGTERLEIVREGFDRLVRKWAEFTDAGLDLDRATSGLWESCMDESTVHSSDSTGTQQLARVLPADPEVLLRRPWTTTERRLVEKLLETYWETRSATWAAYSRNGLVEALQTHFLYIGELIAGDYTSPEAHPLFHFIRKPGDTRT